MGRHDQSKNRLNETDLQDFGLTKITMNPRFTCEDLIYYSGDLNY
jgi:hypothetical protein